MMDYSTPPAVYWQEPRTKAYSCVRNPGDRSSDNGVLFTAEAYHLGLLTSSEAASTIALYFDYSKGALARYPGSQDWSAQDDHIGAASVSSTYAYLIYLWG